MMLYLFLCLSPLLNGALPPENTQLAHETLVSLSHIQSLHFTQLVAAGFPLQEEADAHKSQTMRRDAPDTQTLNDLVRNSMDTLFGYAFQDDQTTQTHIRTQKVFQWTIDTAQACIDTLDDDQLREKMIETLHAFRKKASIAKVFIQQLSGKGLANTADLERYSLLNKDWISSVETDQILWNRTQFQGVRQELFSLYCKLYSQKFYSTAPQWTSAPTSGNAPLITSVSSSGIYFDCSPTRPAPQSQTRMQKILCCCLCGTRTSNE